jgi:hypothetical protein
MPINTTDGPREVPRGTRSHVNTSSLLEPPDLVYEDEPAEILAVLPGGSWCALVGDEAVPMPLWVALDDGSVYGVILGEDGRIDLTDGNAEECSGFSGYVQTTNTDKE